MSSDADTRVVAARITGATSSLTNTASLVAYTTPVFDSHSAYSTGTGLYVVKVPGQYRVSAKIFTNPLVASAAQYMTLYVYKNGSNYDSALITGTGVSAQYTVQITTLVDVVAGDTISIYASSAVSTTLSNISQYNNINIERLSGPSQIAASESVNAFGQNLAGTSIVNGTWVQLTTPTIVGSSHGILSTGGVITIQTPGTYIVTSAVTFNPSASGQRAIRLRKNSSNTGVGEIIPGSGSFVSTPSFTSPPIKFLSGDLITVEVFQDSGGSLALATNADIATSIGIYKVGNY
jgi:hypothetical protein